MKGVLRGNFLSLNSNEYEGRTYYNVSCFDSGRVFNFNTKNPELFKDIPQMQLVDLTVDVGFAKGRTYIVCNGVREVK